MTDKKRDAFKHSLNSNLLEETTGAERTNPIDFPKKIKNIRLLLEYKNALKTKAYTLYTHRSDPQNIFLYKWPRDFKTE